MTNLGTKNYGYDNIYELTSAKYEQNQAFTWSYDPAGNRAFSRDSIPMLSEKTYNVNSLNQYSSVNGTSWSYDADGNLLSNGIQNYTWDIKNRLIGVNSNISYVYDHNDLRVLKTKSGITTRYYYDGSLLLAEKINGQVQKEYINDGQGITGMVNPIYTNGALNHYQRLYYLYDSLGSVSVITGDNGLPLQRYTYSPYGACLNVHNDPINSLQFVGRYGGYLDSDTGLTYFVHRWYDNINGRWISRDPIGVKNRVNLMAYVNSIEKDIDSNLYQYTFNNPNDLIDPNGLSPVDTCCDKNKLKQCLDDAWHNTLKAIAVYFSATGPFEEAVVVGCWSSGPGYLGCIASAHIVIGTVDLVALGAFTIGYFEMRNACYETCGCKK